MNFAATSTTCESGVNGNFVIPRIEALHGSTIASTNPGPKITGTVNVYYGATFPSVGLTVTNLVKETTFPVTSGMLDVMQHIIFLILIKI